MNHLFFPKKFTPRLMWMRSILESICNYVSLSKSVLYPKRVRINNKTLSKSILKSPVIRMFLHNSLDHNLRVIFRFQSPVERHWAPGSTPTHLSSKELSQRVCAPSVVCQKSCNSITHCIAYYATTSYNSFSCQPIYIQFVTTHRRPFPLTP